MYMDYFSELGLRMRGKGKKDYDVSMDWCKYKYSPFYKGVELWKLLPGEIAASDSIFQFKHALKSRYKTYVNI